MDPKECSIGSSNVSTLPIENDDCPRPSLARRVIDSFRRDPDAHVTKGFHTGTGADGKVFDIEGAAANTADSSLQRRLKGRHLQMIAIGGSIGTGLFVASGGVLASGGPASLIIAYSMIGGMLYTTIQALGEMAVLFPVAGTFASFSTRFLDPAWGFAMGWNYALQWLIIFPLEIVAASFTVGYWNVNVSPAVWVTIFWTIVIAINMCGVLGYGEAEFSFSIVKVVAILGFIVLGIVLNCGGGPDGSYIGGEYWSNPGAFNNGFKGLCSVFVNAAFAYAGTELVGLAAAETVNPGKSLPTAAKQVFWRIAIFYVVSLTIVGLLVPYNEPRLLSGTSSADAKASPFVIAITNAGIDALDSVMNAVIMIAILSVGNASVYGSSRTLAALAEQGQAPRILAYIDRQGRPLIAILVAAAVGCLCFLAVSSRRADAFEWMVAISGLSSILTWGSICLAHIRFRAGWKSQGHSLDELAFTSQAGVVGSWIGLTLNILILIVQFWVSFAPIGYASLTVQGRVENFFSSYLTMPVVMLCYFPYKRYYRTSFVKAEDMDLRTGRRDFSFPHLLAEERQERANWPLWKRIYKLFC